MMTLLEVALVLGVSDSTVANIERRAMRCREGGAAAHRGAANGVETLRRDMERMMLVRIIRGNDWETRDVTFECFDRGKAVLHWDGLNGSVVFWLEAGKGHIGGQGVDAPSWLIDAKDLQKLKQTYGEHKRASRKGKKTEATA